MLERKNCEMNFIENITIYIIPSLLICSIYNKINEKRNLENNKSGNIYKFIFILMTTYLSILLSYLISPTYGFSFEINWSKNLNINPLRIFDILCERPKSLIKYIIMFSPYGFLLPLLCGKINTGLKVILSGMILSFFIETFQLFLYKGTDVNHIILASIGTYIGYLIYKFLCLIYKFKIKSIDFKIYDNMKYLLCYFVLIFITVICGGLYINYKNSDNIQARNACLLDADNKSIIYSKSGDEKIAPASTTKMITALTVADYCNINEEVTVGDEIKFVFNDASKAGLKKGDVVTIKQLLDGLLLPSGNDAAYVLARYTGEKISNEKLSMEDAISNFMIYANKKAVSIGANNSNFIRPDGYDVSGQYTTAKDLACIGDEFMKSKLLSSIVSKYKLNDEYPNGSQVKYENTNELINPYSEYYYSDIKGLKTGSSLNAGKCVVSVADIDNKTYICVVMGSTDKGRWMDSLCLYQSIK